MTPAAIALAGLALVGCGSPEDGAAAGDIRTAPVAGSVLRRGNGAEPETLDPHRARGAPEFNVLRDLYEGLVREGLDSGLEPGVARRWEIDDDGTQYTFYLRREARWSNGEPVTAQDFVFALQRAVDPAHGAVHGSMLAPIMNAPQIVAGSQPPQALGVTALDPAALRIELSAPTPYFLALLTHAAAYPVHGPSLEKHGTEFVRSGNRITNGAYRLVDWRPHQYIELERNPHYWDAANVTIDVVRYYPIEDAAAELRRYRAGELDFTNAVPNSQLDWVRENHPDELHIAPYLGTYYLLLNLTRPPLDDPRIRQALSMAVDRDRLTREVTRAGQLPAYGWIPPGVAGYEPQEYAWRTLDREARLSAARHLYAEAGYSVSHPLSVTILYDSGDNHRRNALAVAAMWRTALGAEVKLENQEWKVFLQTRKDLERTQLMRSGWVGDYNDANSFAEVFVSGHPYNDGGYANPHYDALVRSALGETDPRNRQSFHAEAERQLLHDYPLIPLYFFVSRHLVKPYVENFSPGILDRNDSRHLSIRHP